MLPVPGLSRSKLLAVLCDCERIGASERGGAVARPQSQWGSAPVVPSPWFHRLLLLLLLFHSFFFLPIAPSSRSSSPVLLLLVALVGAA